MVNKYRNSQWLFMFLVGLTCFGATATEVHAKLQLPAGEYAINLESRLKPFNSEDLVRIIVPEGKRPYQSQFEKDGVLWYRLRLGFFDDYEQTKHILDKAVKTFQGAWITKVSEEEKRLAYSPDGFISATEQAVAKESTSDQQAIGVGVEKEGTLLPSSDGAKLLAEADAEMTEESYTLAVQLYTKLTKEQNEAIREEAQYKLAVAREKNGQLAHAKAEYRRYLKLYPEGTYVSEAQQRLDVIQRTGLPTRKSGASQEGASGWSKDFYGSFSQFYYRNETTTDTIGSTVNQSSLNSDLDFNLRLRNKDFDLRTVFIGGHEEDLLDDGDTKNRVSSAYIDVRHLPTDHSLTLGRQRESKGGVLGRYDGVLLGARLIDKLKLNLVGGYPVQTSSDNLQTDRYFYGVNLDVGTISKYWNYNLFYINQETEGISDREAVGGEVRFSHPMGSFFNLVDYDISYDKLNVFLFVANKTLPSGTTFNLTADYRLSPYLSTTNALIGQTTDSLESLLDSLGEDAVRNLAADRTAVSKLGTFSVTQPINEKLQVAADITWSRLDGTPESGGVQEIPGSGDEYYTSLQLIGNNLITVGDLAIVGLRYGDTSSYDLYAINLSSRYPLTREWRINPRIVVEYRDYRATGAEQVNIIPSLRTDYRWNKSLLFELESGYELEENRSSRLNDRDSRGFYLICGLRYRF